MCIRDRLKRGFSNTLKELLMSAEYIMASGNDNVILCERGIRTFETYTRNTLDLSAVPMLRELTHLPICLLYTSFIGREQRTFTSFQKCTSSDV